MAVFGYDETLGGTRAAGLDVPLLELLTEVALEGSARRVGTAWSAGGLAGADVLTVVEPDGDVPRQAELGALSDFVRSGGGLLVVAGSRQSRSAAAILAAFGMELTDIRIGSPRPENDRLLSDDVECTGVPGSPIAVEGRRFVCRHAVALKEGAGQPTAVVRGTGTAVAVSSRFGRGRVAAIGSSAMFSTSYIGAADNALLYVDTLAWLAGPATSPDSDADRERRTRVLLNTRRSVGLAAAAGPIPAIDVSEHREVLSRLYPPDLNPYQDIESFLRNAGMAFHELPAPVRSAVRDFRVEANKHGALLVRGLPTDPRLPPTPSEPKKQPAKASHVSEFWLAVFGSALGEQVGYNGESDGSLFQNVVPTKRNARTLSSESSEAPLGLHTEMAFHPALPDYLLLTCLRGAAEGNADTLVAGVRTMLPLVAPAHLPALFRRAFRTGVDYSFGSPNGEPANGPLAQVLRGDPADPLLCLDPDLMRGEDEEAQQALEAISAAADDCGTHVTLAAADLLVVDNLRAVHGRSAFAARFDGHDRWLQRSYVLRDLPRHAGELGGSRRTLCTGFAY